MTQHNANLRWLEVFRQTSISSSDNLTYTIRQCGQPVNDLNYIGVINMVERFFEDFSFSRTNPNGTYRSENSLDSKLQIYTICSIRIRSRK